MWQKMLQTGSGSGGSVKLAYQIPKATGVSANISSSDESYKASWLAFDQSASTFWSTGAYGPQWIKYAFNTPNAITNVYMICSSATDACDYTIEFALTDGTIVTKNTGSVSIASIKAGYTFELDKPITDVASITIKNVQNMHDTYGKFARFDEIQVNIL